MLPSWSAVAVSALSTHLGFGRAALAEQCSRGGALSRSFEAAGWVKEPAAGPGSAEIWAIAPMEALAWAVLCASLFSPVREQ